MELAEKFIGEKNMNTKVIDEQEKITREQAQQFGDNDVCAAIANLETDDHRAEYFLGEAHDFGEHGLSKDYAQAKYWYERAARHGDIEAQTNLGYMYAHGNGMPVDGKKAIAWYKLASQNGSYLAMGNLAYFYLEGIFMDAPDPEMAVKLYEKAIKLGLAKDCYKYMYDLGSCYEKGRGVAPNLKKAIQLYEKSAKFGSGLAKKALRRLGVIKSESTPAVSSTPVNKGVSVGIMKAGERVMA